jgi:hypothetical protein
MSDTYKCGNCKRLFGDRDEYVVHYMKCRRVPEDEPEVPEFGSREWKVTDYDRRVVLRPLGIKVE